MPARRRQRARRVDWEQEEEYLGDTSHIFKLLQKYYGRLFSRCTHLALKIPFHSPSSIPFQYSHLHGIPIQLVSA